MATQSRGHAAHRGHATHASIPRPPAPPPPPPPPPPPRPPRAPPSAPPPVPAPLPRELVERVLQIALAGHPVELLLHRPILEDQHRRDRRDLVLHAHRLVVVDVHLPDLDLPVEALGELVDRRPQQAARLAPL